MSARRYLLEKRVLVNGKTSQLNLDNYLDLREYIALVALGSTSSTTPLTFEGGLSKDAFNVATLGGTLTANTLIDKGGFVFGITGAGIGAISNINGDTTSAISAGLNSAILSAIDTASVTSGMITVNNTGSVVLSAIDTAIVAGLTLSASTGNVLSYTADGITVGRISMVPDIGNATIGVKMTSCIPAFADDAAAGVAGLTTGALFQTTGLGAAPLNAAGILMIKQ